RVAEVIEKLGGRFPGIEEKRPVAILVELGAHGVGCGAPAYDLRQELNALEQRPLPRKGRRDREENGDGEMQAKRDGKQQLPLELEQHSGDEDGRGRI